MTAGDSELSSFLVCEGGSGRRAGAVTAPARGRCDGSGRLAAVRACWQALATRCRRAAWGPPSRATRRAIKMPPHEPGQEPSSEARAHTTATSAFREPEPSRARAQIAGETARRTASGPEWKRRYHSPAPPASGAQGGNAVTTPPHPSPRIHNPPPGRTRRYSDCPPDDYERPRPGNAAPLRGWQGPVNRSPGTNYVIPPRIPTSSAPGARSAGPVTGGGAPPPGGSPPPPHPDRAGVPARRDRPRRQAAPPVPVRLLITETN